MSVDYCDVLYCIVQRGMKPRVAAAQYIMWILIMPAKAWLVSSAEPALGLKRRLEKETMFEFGYIRLLVFFTLRAADLHGLTSIDTCHKLVNPPTTLNTSLDTLLGCYSSPYLM